MGDGRVSSVAADGQRVFWRHGEPPPAAVLDAIPMEGGDG